MSYSEIDSSDRGLHMDAVYGAEIVKIYLNSRLYTNTFSDRHNKQLQNQSINLKKRGSYSQIDSLYRGIHVDAVYGAKPV